MNTVNNYSGLVIFFLILNSGINSVYYTPEFTENSVFTEDLSEIDSFYLNYKYQGWVKFNDSLEFDRTTITNLIIEQDAANEPIIDILACNFNFTRILDSKYQVEIFFVMMNYSFEGKLYFDFDSFQYATQEDYSDYCFYAPLIIPNDNQPIPLGNSNSTIFYSSPEFMNQPEISELKCYKVADGAYTGGWNDYNKYKKNNLDQYLGYYDICYLDTFGGGLLKVSMKYNIRLWGGGMQSIEYLLVRACEDLTDDFEAEIALNLDDTDLNLFYSVDPTKYDYNTSGNSRSIYADSEICQIVDTGLFCQS